jgi:hypothetical protein
MAAASPPLDPPAVHSRFHGLRVLPYSRFSVSYAIRNSGQLVVPSKTAPAASSRSTTTAFSAGTKPRFSVLPISQRYPAAEIDDFTVTGRPESGPGRGWRA